MGLQGKKTFITAAGQGIGRAIAQRFARDGAEVTATDRDADLLANLFKDQTTGPHATFALDVLDKDALQSAITAAAPDILINCAGYVHAGTIAEATDAEFDFAMDLNVRSQFHAIQAVLPGMVERGGGAIINIASVASSLKGFPNRFIYSTSKAAVIGLTKSVACDYVTLGIRCNCIAPGTVDSPSLQDRLRATGDYDTALREFIARQPMRRLGQADEIAGLAAFLASDEAKYMTGQCVAIDGGTTT
ncbi:SDR family oxidoreductase [Marinovum sp. 2_MG-2023]|uniref:SDR family oxidoreductase n=1 Tax=unclassified Marinovum TaxID=2647166 RepID=UPI0026E1D185|nr:MULTISPECIES: SDR family oxidoreductase [unclassified Marinovum]MDO6732769.1 SDR family oxidoreductase [Marinovum sp. 2_MG-2023]MDO6781891.1 SDR family oxidoreductase [Marinovum sp. 1_MG-2023]